MFNINHIGWVLIISSNEELSDFDYKELESGNFYKVQRCPEINSTSYLRVFLEDFSFHIVHERHFRVLDINECKQHDRNDKLKELLK